MIMATSCCLALTVGEMLHGFRVESVTDLPEVPAKMVRMAYVKNGADLVWLDRADENKTFAIAFKTLPDSSDGVAHVLEHSVLCGSEKYPVKEPFVDLLKSSLATFLNAITYPDKTVYPVSSRNGRDFLNLADVYLDAVFHPLSVTNGWALKQEGWHYEFAADAKGEETLVRNGVVYSEMKGSYANPNAVAFRETMKLLFPGHTYGFSSGGDPAHIPELTPERYRAFHARFYHPSNARIFLDGQVDMDATLALLDGYLKAYDRREAGAGIPLQQAVSNRARVAYESAQTTNKTLLADGWVIGTYADREAQLALDVVSRVLVGSNEAPLKKALLDAGLCEDVDLWSDSLQQPVAVLLLRNTSEEKAAACRRTVRETLERLCREGLDRKQLAAQLDNLRFHAREKDVGWATRGLAFMDTALAHWLYGGDPAEGFRMEALFASLRAKIATGGFERYLKKFFLDNPHHAEVTLVPSATLGAERTAALAKELAALKAKMSPDELATVRAEAKRLKEIQNAPDRPEDVAKLPRLDVSGIPLTGTLPKATVDSVDGVTVIRPETRADGIFYLDLCFSLAGLTEAELLDLPLLTELLGELATESFSALELRRELDGRLGRSSFSCRSFEKGPQLIVHVSALEAHKDDAVRLMSEVALRTKFADAEAIGNLLVQKREGMEESVQTSGNAFAMTRAACGLSAANRTSELFGGVEQVRHLQERCAAGNFAKTGASLAALAKKVFVRNRLTICATGAASEEPFVRSCLAAFPAGEKPSVKWNGEPVDAVPEGFSISAPVGFAATANRLPAEAPYCGAQQVAARILTLDYLWNEVRVKGGAYGTRFSVRPNGDVLTMTYRDPNPSRSLKKLAEAGTALEKFVASGEPFGKYQVATIGATEPYLTPRREAQRAYELHFNGRTPDDLARLRREILTTTREDLGKFAQTLVKLVKSSRICVVAGEKLLEPCKLKKTEAVRK